MKNKTYLAYDGRFHKIGTSDNPESRMTSLRCSNPSIELLHSSEEGTSELVMHKLYKQYRVEGTREWYKFPKKVLEEVIYYIYNVYDKDLHRNPLKNRVNEARIKMERDGIKSALYMFCVKYPEYKDKKGNPSDRVKNLWYCKISDIEFTVKIEAFATYMETYLKD